MIAGVVAAILGTETRAGDFEVADIIFAGIPPPKKPVKSEDTTMDAADSAENWVALVSGLELDVIQDSVATRSAKAHDQGSEESDDKDMFGSARKEIRSMLLVEWLLGAAGDDEVCGSEYRWKQSHPSFFQGTTGCCTCCQSYYCRQLAFVKSER